MAEHRLRHLLTLALVLASLAPGRVQAQWSQRPTLIALPSPAERWGVTAGSFRIRPRLTVEGRYDTNLFREDASESPSSAGILRILAGLTVVNPKARVLRVYLDIEGDGRIYFSKDANAEKQRNGGGTLSLDLSIFPKSAISLRIFDRFQRALQTRNWSSDGNYNRNMNLAGAELLFRPGGGALEFGLQYAYSLDKFDEFSQGNTYYHDFAFHAAWKFYPLTAVFLDVDFKLLGYDEPWLDETRKVANVDSKPLSGVLGIVGAVTKRISVLLQAGWAYGMYDSGEDFNGPVGTARVSYRATRRTLLQLGYSRDYEDSYHGNFYAEHRIFLAVQQQLFNRLDLRVDASYGFLDYARFVPGDGATTVNEAERSDQVLRVKAGVSFDVARWFGVTAGYQYEALFSEFSTKFQVGGGSREAVPTFYRHQVYLGLTGRY